jgi:hypothetical protein
MRFARRSSRFANALPPPIRPPGEGSASCPVKYNRKVRKFAFLAVLALLAACTKDIQNKDAVRGAIVDYLKARESKTGLKMDAMEVEVSTMTFSSSGNEAHATVKFTPKGGGAGMDMPYTLDRNGNQWVVRAHAEGGENPHGAVKLPAMPPSHPPATNPGDRQP